MENTENVYRGDIGSAGAVRRGLLIVNLGSPSSPQPAQVREFLREFLRDPRVVDFPRPLWLPILHGIVLRTRPRKSSKLYQSIWNAAGSPLVIFTKSQCDHLAAELPHYSVKYAMTYTQPRISQVLSEFAAEGITDLTVVSLYPQSAPSSTGAITDQVFSHYAGALHTPNLRMISQYPVQPDYISWYVEAVSKHLAQHNFDLVVFSFHGVPARDSHRPQGYRAECNATAAEIMAGVREQGHDVASLVTFQSKFGPGKWLTPATIDTMRQLPAQGIKSVLVATPGFISDCLETIDEIGVLNRDVFLTAGGEHFSRVLPPNDDPIVTQIIKNMLPEN